MGLWFLGTLALIQLLGLVFLLFFLPFPQDTLLLLGERKVELLASTEVLGVAPEGIAFLDSSVPWFPKLVVPLFSVGVELLWVPVEVVIPQCPVWGEHEER